FDPTNQSPHEQWIWERADSKHDALLQTMYWDCIFAADLWKTGVLPLRSKFKKLVSFPKLDFEKPDIGALIRVQVSSFQQLIQKHQDDLKQSITDVIALLGQIRIDKGVQAAIDMATQQLRDEAEQAGKAAEEAARLADEARKQAQKTV